MTAADRTSKLLDKLQQVEAIGEGARQAMRKENVELAAHEEELLEEVRSSPLVSYFNSFISLTFSLSRRCACCRSTFHPRSRAAAAFISSCMSPQFDTSSFIDRVLKWTHRSRQFFSEFKLCRLLSLQLVGAAP